MTYRDTTITLNKLKFEEQQLIVALEDYTFTRSSDDRFSDEVMSKDLKQLRHDADSLSVVLQNCRKLSKRDFFPDRNDLSLSAGYRKSNGFRRMAGYRFAICDGCG